MQGRQSFLTFLTIVTRWSRFTSNFYVLIGQNLAGEFMRKIYAASWNLFTDSWSCPSFVSSCDVFSCLFLLDVQRERQLLSRFFCNSFMVCFLRFSWVEKCTVCQSLLTCVNCQGIVASLDGLREQHLDWWTWVYYCLWRFLFSGFLRSSVVYAASLCTRQWSYLQ